MTGNAAPPPAPAAALLDLAAVASRLGVSTKTARRMVERGDLPVFRIGRLLRVSEDDLAQYLTRARRGCQ